MDIVVTALTSQSAMATYVCNPPVDPAVGCTPEDADEFDNRGIAINLVTLSTSTASIQNINLAVVGWGDGEQQNLFSVGATVTSHV